jgi:hypothetical protein
LTLLAALTAPALSGCSGVRLQAALGPSASLAEDSCAKIEKPYLVWGTLALSAGALAGSAGVSTLGFGPNADGSRSLGQLGFAIASVAVGAFSAAATFLAGHYAASYTHCQKALVQRLKPVRAASQLRACIHCGVEHLAR